MELQPPRKGRGDLGRYPLSHSPRHGIVNFLSDLCSSRLVSDTRLMSTPLTHRDKNHRFPAEIISHDIWLYFRFCLSYRDVEE